MTIRAKASPEEYQHNADRRPRVQGGGQNVFGCPEISVCDSENDEERKHTVVFSPEGETAPPDQILEDKPNHSPRDVI